MKLNASRIAILWISLQAAFFPRRLVLVAALLAVAFGAFAQSTERRPTISSPEFVAENPVDAEVAHKIARAVVDDLRKSGKLTVIEPAGDDTKVDARVEGRVIRTPDGRIDVQMRLWDVAHGAYLSGHQYTVDRAQWHVVASAISDSIHEKLAGNPATPARK